MASWQMRGLGLLFRVFYKPRYATEAAGLERLHAEKGDAEPPAGVTADRAVRRYDTHGFPVVVIGPAADVRAPDAAVVYLHGGAYTNQIVKQQWQLAAELADRVGCEVHVPLYGLAPDHRSAEAVAFVGAVLSSLAAEGRRLHVIGDSSGGGLALLGVQQADPAARAAVAGLTVLAPWLDLSLSNPELPALEKVDPWLTRAGLRPIARAWAGETPLDDPRVSPLFADLSALPPVGIWVGTRDLTLADCRLLRDRLPTGRCRFHELDGGLHVYALLPVPEGRRARQEIATHIEESLATG